MSGLLLQKILVCGKRIREIQLVAQRPFYFSFLRCSRSVPRFGGLSGRRARGGQKSPRNPKRSKVAAALFLSTFTTVFPSDPGGIGP